MVVSGSYCQSMIYGCYCQSMIYGCVWLLLSVYDILLCLVGTFSQLSTVVSGYDL